MYEIDPSRTDLVEEFRNNPGGPNRPEVDVSPLSTILLLGLGLKRIAPVITILKAAP